MGFLGNQREQRRVKAVMKRDGALLNQTLAAYTAQVGTFEPEFGPHHVAALRAAMVGAASSLVQLRARVSTSEDISAIAGGFDSETGTYRAGLYPAATLRDAPEDSLEPMFRILTWAHMTDVISEFWWPDYYWETARVAVMFGIRGPGERLMIAYGPNPGSVFHQADLAVEYSLAKMRGALCAMVNELTDKRIADDDLWIDLLLHNWWSEAFMAGGDEMGVTLKEASPEGYPYTVGVAEAREGKEFQHSPPPRMDEAAVRDVEGAWTLCEQGLSLVGDYPSENDPLYEDIAALMDAYVQDVAKAGGSEASTSVMEAILAGYLAAEAEHKQGLGLPVVPIVSQPIHEQRADVLGDAAFLSEAEIANVFAYHQAGWLAVQRWSFAHVSLLHRMRAGAAAAPTDKVGERHVPKSSGPARIVISSNPSPPSRTQLLALYGEAMLAAQEFEEALAGLLGVRRELALIAADELTEEVQEELERLWNSLFTRTAGSLRNELGLAGGLGIAVDEAIETRNLLAHHYLRDRAVRLSQDCLEADDVGRLDTTIERFRHLAQRLDGERFAAMHEAGLTDDEVTTPGEARRIRYYDPRLDDDVPPEPFED